ncbi:MAG TPA: metallophosphoesterase [Acidobacteriota bacterium]|nr:metallophosphoesterase [Acidobacteriota bacterium]
MRRVSPSTDLLMLAELQRRRPRRWWRQSVMLLAALSITSCGNSLYIRHDFDAQAEPVRPGWRLLLLGDGGADNPARTAVLTAARSYVAAAPERTTIVWLGDNLYNRGLPAEGETDAKANAERRRGELILTAQMELARAGARAYFVPGNHDWDHSGKWGLARIRAAGRFIATGRSSRQIPGRGCPGPIWVDLTPGSSPAPPVRLVFLDTEWLLTTEHARGWEGCAWGPLDAGTPYEGSTADPRLVYERLSTGLREATEQGLLAVVAGHHPIYTAGSHGGFFPADEWIFSPRMLKKWAWIPIPVVGPLLRKIGGKARGQDLWATANKELVGNLMATFADHPPLLYAAGHEHDLQVFRDQGDLPTTYVVSGSAAKSTSTTQRDNTLFKSPGHGFMVLDGFGAGHSAQLRVVVVNKETGDAHAAFCAELEGGRSARACDRKGH